MFVVYTSTVDEEIIITTKGQEKKMLKDYFRKDSGRTRRDYEREEGREVSSCVVLTPKIRVEID